MTMRKAYPVNARILQVAIRRHSTFPGSQNGREAISRVDESICALPRLLGASIALRAPAVGQAALAFNGLDAAFARST